MVPQEGVAGTAPRDTRSALGAGSRVVFDPAGRECAPPSAGRDAPDLRGARPDRRLLGSPSGHLLGEIRRRVFDLHPEDAMKRPAFALALLTLASAPLHSQTTTSG